VRLILIIVNLKSFLKLNAIIFVTLLAFLVFPTKSLAASAFFDILPERNPIAVGGETTVNVFLNTNSNNISLARVVLTYDPDILQVTAVKYADLFCQYPDDAASYSVDNSLGEVKVTGFCETDPVNTTTDFELFAKITFKGRNAGTSDIESKFSTAGGLNETAAYDDKSPPQNVLTVEPSKISMGVGATTNIPGTAIDRSWILYLSILIFILGIGTFGYLKLKQSKETLKH
jgi:hypothetical protein